MPIKLRSLARDVSLLAALCTAGVANATLFDRGPDMVYDSALNVTWTRQAGDGVLRTWSEAVTWADTLSFGGFDDWRLPWESVSGNSSPTYPVVTCETSTQSACRDNEMGYMFTYNLGGINGSPKLGSQTAVGGQELTGIQTLYWSGTPYLQDNIAWIHTFNTGDVGVDDKSQRREFAWAVRSGDVITTAVPEPATYAMMLTGLLMLYGFATRRKMRRVRA